MDPTIIAALVSALGAILAAIMAALSKKLWTFRIRKVSLLEAERPSDPEEECRLTEARRFLERQDSIAAWNKRANASLTFSQYIVGGVLATSFMQNVLSKELVGFLGVIVLVSKLIHQHYRPDVSFQSARYRAFRLRKLIRTAEDNLYALQQGEQNEVTLYDIRQMISKGLSLIEEDELAEFHREGTEERNAEQG